MADFSAIYPELILLAFALALPAIHHLKSSSKLLSAIAGVGVAASMASVLYFLVTAMPPVLGGLVQFDVFAALFALVFLSVAFYVIVASARYVEKDRATYGALFVDGAGNPIPEAYNAQVDQVEGTLKLGSSSSYDRIHDSLGTTTATISIIEQAGEGFSDKDPNYGISNAIDNRPDTFWGEVILSDGVLKVPMAGLDSGAICRFKITFPSACSVSQFSMRPYGEFPLEIVSIGYTVDDSNSISGYAIEYDQDNPIMVEDGITLDFPRVNAKSLIVTIRQSHAYKNYYTISSDVRYRKDIWSKIIAAERKLTLDTPWVDDDPSTANPTLDQDKIDELDTLWQAYLLAKREYDRKHQEAVMWGIIAFLSTALLGSSFIGVQGVTPTTVLSGSILAGYQTYLMTSPDSKPLPPQRVQVEKYEYVYGAYDIQVRGNEYNPVGIYVSKPHEVNGNVQRAVLEASEWHPVFKNSAGSVLCKKAYTTDGTLVTTDTPIRKTSIEYYLACGDSPKDPWIPILPLDQAEVNNELLRFLNLSHPTACLRFAADTTKPVRLYRDDEPVDPLYWNFTNDPATGMASTRYITVNLAVWDPHSYYTIDYTPDETVTPAHEIDFLTQGAVTKHRTEYFNGVGTDFLDKNGSCKLTYYPFIDRAKLIQDRNSGTFNYNPVQVVLNPSEYQYLDPNIHRIQGKTRAITSQISSTRNPSTSVTPVPEARLLNVTDYFSTETPVLNYYNPQSAIPTFEYYHIGNRVYFTETFRHDGPQANFGISHGNAVVRVDYDYLVSGIRCKIILRRTSTSDASVTPKVDWYAIKLKVLV